MKRPLLVLLVLCVGPLAACEMTGGGCPPGVGDGKEYFKTTGFSTTAVRATFPDSLQIRPDLSPIAGDTLASGQLAIQMTPEKVLYSQALPPSVSFHLLPAAHACSPVEPRSEERIQDIRLSSNRSFRGHPPGDTLSAFFDVVARNRAEYGTRRFELDAFRSMEPRAVDELILLLDARPETTARFRFTVEYEQEGPGLDTYEYTTAPIVLPAAPS